MTQASDQDQDVDEDQDLDPFLERLSRLPAEPFLFEQPGQRLVGRYVRLERRPTREHGMAWCMVIADETDDGRERSVLLSNTLTSQFRRLRPVPGERVGVVYLGERRSGRGYRYADFTAQVDRDEAEPGWDDVAGEDLDDFAPL